MSDIQVDIEGIQNSLSIRIQYPSISTLTYNFKLTVQVFEQDIVRKVDQKVYERSFHTVQKNIVVEGLKFSHMYKVTIRNSYAREEEKIKHVFAFTKSEGVREDADGDEDDQYENENERSIQDQSSLRQRDQGFNFSQSYRNRPETSKNAKQKMKTTHTTVSKNHNPNSELSNSELLIKTIGHASRISNKSQIHKYLLEGRNCKNIDEFINEKEGRRRNRQEVMNKKMLVVKGKILFSEVYKHREGSKFFKNDWCMGPFYSYDHNEQAIRKN